MFIVIFRAKISKIDETYTTISKKLRDLALTKFGCLEFHAVTEGDNEIALSYWPDEEKIRAWKQHSDHLLAQQLAKKVGMNLIQFKFANCGASMGLESEYSN